MSFRRPRLFKECSGHAAAATPIAYKNDLQYTVGCGHLTIYVKTGKKQILKATAPRANEFTFAVAPGNYRNVERGDPIHIMFEGKNVKWYFGPHKKKGGAFGDHKPLLDNKHQPLMAEEYKDKELIMKRFKPTREPA